MLSSAPEGFENGTSDPIKRDPYFRAKLISACLAFFLAFSAGSAFTGVFPKGFFESKKVESSPPSRHTPFEVSPPLPPLESSLAESSGDWSQEDLENAAHFPLAMEASDKAWALCKQRVGSTRPWLMDENDRQEFARLINQANAEGVLVRKDVLQRMHADLPTAFDHFVEVTFYMPSHVITRHPSARNQQLWGQWSSWLQANRSGIHMPAGIRQARRVESQPPKLPRNPELAGLDSNRESPGQPVVQDNEGEPEVEYINTPNGGFYYWHTKSGHRDSDRKRSQWQPSPSATRTTSAAHTRGESSPVRRTTVQNPPAAVKVVPRRPATTIPAKHQ
jgi:hypothetical protein